MTHPIHIMALILCSFLILGGCEKKSAPPEKKVVRSKITQESAPATTQSDPGTTGSESTAAEPVKEAEETLNLQLAKVYVPEGRPDPFKPLFQDEKVETPAKKDKKKKFIPRTPLQKVDLSQLKVSGIIRGSSGHKALVEEASGKGYIVTEGTYIGNKGGKIVAIQKDMLVVEEPDEDNYGKEILKKREMKINKPSGDE